MLLRCELAALALVWILCGAQFPVASYQLAGQEKESGAGSRKLEAGNYALARHAYTRALEVEAQGNQAAALALLWEAAGLAPGEPDIQNHLGEALQRIGALDAAIDAYRSALAARPDFPKATKNLILTLVQAGRGPEAVARARAAVAAAPGDPDAWFTLGLAQSEQDVNEALRTFQHVLELAPRHTLARYNLALVLQRVDRVSESIEELKRAVAIEPRPEAYYSLGVIYWHQGQLDDAERALREAVRLEPRYADAHQILGVVLAARHQSSAAAASLRRAIALRPDLWSARYTLARVLREGGDQAGARRELAEAERLRRQSDLEHEALVWTSTGTTKLEAGDLAGALERFRRATQIFEAYAPAYYQMGRALDGLGQHEAARAAFTRAQQLNPSLVPPRETP